MLATAVSGVVRGIEGFMVRVEIDVSRGLPAFSIVGLGDSAVREGRDRVVAALRNSGFRFPSERVTVNLAPAGIRKEGARFDLAVALAVLAATGQADGSCLGRYAALGELALDGTLRPVSGVLAVARAALDSGLRGLLVPRENATEASVVRGVEVLPVGSLCSAVNVLNGGAPDSPLLPATEPETTRACPDLCEVKGQQTAKRALEVCAAGAHNLLLTGPPGVGKTMLARALPGILPALSPDEAETVTTIHSCAGLTGAGRGLVQTPPFRAPHHSTSLAGLLGGGRGPRPGEVSLAHAGVLFLDEIPEFHRDALEALRQPLEEGTVRLVRADGTVELPAAFTLLASMNPCPCGYLGDPERECRCTPTMLRRYAQRVSGPLMDRIDMVVRVGRVSVQALEDGEAGELSTRVRRRVVSARECQRQRYGIGRYSSNGRVPARRVLHSGELTAAARAALRAAAGRMSLSVRAFHKVVRVARTVADLECSPQVTRQHVLEAFQYREQLTSD